MERESQLAIDSLHSVLEPSLTTIQLQNRATDQDVLVQVRLGSTTLVPRNMFAKLHWCSENFLVYC